MSLTHEYQYKYCLVKIKDQYVVTKKVLFQNSSRLSHNQVEPLPVNRESTVERKSKKIYHKSFTATNMSSSFKYGFLSKVPPSRQLGCFQMYNWRAWRWTGCHRLEACRSHGRDNWPLWRWHWSRRPHHRLHEILPSSRLPDDTLLQAVPTVQKRLTYYPDKPLHWHRKKQCQLSLINYNYLIIFIVQLFFPSKELSSVK